MDLAPAIPCPEPFDRRLHGPGQRPARRVLVERPNHGGQPHVVHGYRSRDSRPAAVPLLVAGERPPFRTHVHDFLLDDQPAVRAIELRTGAVYHHPGLAAPWAF